MNPLKIFLSRLLGGILRGRHYLYDKNWLPSKAFDFPVIGIGNLNVGGAGKTPVTGYLIELLSPHYKVAVLSRGYKRKTRGFLLAGSSTGWQELGDEPYQLFKKYGDKISVAVCEDRVEGVRRLQEEVQPDVILLDDAFQHRKIRPGLQLLLTPYDRIFTEDKLFPAGNLRDIPGRARAADIILVTKVPPRPSGERKKEILNRLQAFQKPVFFFRMQYGNPTGENQILDWESLRNKKVLLITGIANPEPLLAHLKANHIRFSHLSFPDHAAYNDKQVRKISRHIEKFRPGFLLTTEKDFAKLKVHFPDILYIPFRLEPENKVLFNQKIFDYVNTRKSV